MVYLKYLIIKDILLSLTSLFSRLFEVVWKKLDGSAAKVNIFRGVSILLCEILESPELVF